MKIVFKFHAMWRLQRRGILEQDIFDALKYPDRIMKMCGRHYFIKNTERGTLKVCCEIREKTYIRHYSI